jgi:hypothetical protein
MGHGIVSPEAGWTLFGWLIAVFISATVIFALSLQLIVSRVRRVESAIGNLYGGPRSNSLSPEIERSVAALQTALENLKHRRRTRNPAPEHTDLESGIELDER